MSAALEYLNLPKSEDLELGERFLIQLAASVMTASQMEGISSATASADEVLREVLKQTQTPKWKNEKLKQTAFLILGTILRAHVTDHKTDFDKSRDIVVRNHSFEFNELTDNYFQTKVIKHLINELDSCKEVECRVVLLHAIGNTGIIKDGVFLALKKYTLSGKRESIAAMKALRECLQVSGTDDKLNSRLRVLLLRVIYDTEQDTTSRLIAAELISKYINDEKTTRELIKHLPSFGNFLIHY